MKIEKINDNQIRCILSKEDLEMRNLKLSELAYGNEKARALFRDMMIQAAARLGFLPQNSPLMIEAVPLGNGSIILIVTRVDNPEELDTRFSKFAPSVQKNVREPSGIVAVPDPLFQAMKENLPKPPVHDEKEEVERWSRFLFTNRMFVFRTLDDAIRAAVLTAPLYTGESALYKDNGSGMYYLTLQMPDPDAVTHMQHVLSTLSEYGTVRPISIASRQHLKEHCTVLCEKNALGMLAGLG